MGQEDSFQVNLDKKVRVFLQQIATVTGGKVRRFARFPVFSDLSGGKILTYLQQFNILG
jgi:hypothetical protein